MLYAKIEGDAMEKIDAIWEHDYHDDCLPNFFVNTEVPRHRWYDFKEGFSSTLVERAIRETRKTNAATDFTVLDPFSGSGTSALVALQNDCNAMGYEVNPFMSFVSRTKCEKQKYPIDEYKRELQAILSEPVLTKESPLEGVSTFTSSEGSKKWLFNKDVIRGYEALYSHIENVKNQDFFRLALIAAIMDCCNAKKDGKCLRYIKGWENLAYNLQSLRETFKNRAIAMISDVETNPLIEKNRIIQQGDTRLLLKDTPNNMANLVIFSPPYLNSFDYSDIYRPELFLGKFVSNNSELMGIRKQTLRSHVQCQWATSQMPNYVWVNNLVTQLEHRKDKLWNNRIPEMVSSYFYDMETVLRESYRIAMNGAQLWFVVSTSAYAGIEIPVDLILADIATKHGWELESVNALRKLRTSSQCIDENKQRVKLRESLIICRK